MDSNEKIKIMTLPFVLVTLVAESIEQSCLGATRLSGNVELMNLYKSLKQSHLPNHQYESALCFIEIKCSFRLCKLLSKNAHAQLK